MIPNLVLYLGQDSSVILKVQFISEVSIELSHWLELNKTLNLLSFQLHVRASIFLACEI